MPQKAIPSSTLATAVREYLGLSQAQLAAYLGITRGQIAHVEAGRRVLQGAASQWLRQLVQLLPALNGSAEAGAGSMLPEVVTSNLLRRRQARCIRQAANLRTELIQLEARAARARRWQLLLSAWRAEERPQAADAHTARQRQLLVEWAATAATALGPDTVTMRVLLRVRIQHLEAEAITLGEMLAAQPGAESLSK